MICVVNIVLIKDWGWNLFWVDPLDDKQMKINVLPFSDSGLLRQTNVMGQSMGK
jgi:hypothetical protein